MARSAVNHLLFAVAVVAIGWLLLSFAPMPALPAKPPTTGTTPPDTWVDMMMPPARLTTP
jgi:hypothetical protein